MWALERDHVGSAGLTLPLQAWKMGTERALLPDAGPLREIKSLHNHRPLYQVGNPNLKGRDGELWKPATPVMRDGEGKLISTGLLYSRFEENKAKTINVFKYIYLLHISLL